MTLFFTITYGRQEEEIVLQSQSNWTFGKLCNHLYSVDQPFDELIVSA